MVSKDFGRSASGEIKKGTLKKTGLHYYARFMGRGDLDKNIGLQDDVIEALKAAGKENYIIPKDKAYFTRLLDRGNAIIGIFVQDGTPDGCEGLAAHMLLVYPRSEGETGLTDPATLPEDDLKTMAVVSNVLVHPWFRGNRLMEKMLCEGLALAAAAGKSNALAEICLDNPYSWSVFLDCGFAIYAEGKDPADGADLVYVHKKLDSSFVYSNAPGDTVSLTLFDDKNAPESAAHQRLKDLLAQGYHAVAYNRETKGLELKKCLGRTAAAQMPAPPTGPPNSFNPG